MGKIFIIGDNENSKQLGFEKIALPALQEAEIHDWVNGIFKKYEIKKLIIELDGNSILAIKIALHIRLHLENLKEKALLPILFVSTSTLSNIINDENLAGWSHILATHGISFTSYENVKLEAENIEGLPPEKYKTHFLNIIKILPDEKIGRHSLANIWGAFSLDKSAKTRALKDNEGFKKNQANLYFKYVFAQNFDTNKLKPKSLKIVGKIDLTSLEKPNKIDAKDKKILLIDDEADKGWETVLKKIFKTSSPSDFVVIKEEVKCFNDFSDGKKIIEQEEFDLFLVDLRLNGLDEEEVQDTNDFSGMKILKKIKNQNRGNQVIIFTASNKAWNLKKLLDAGADGYYVKESPEYNFSEKFSNQNYLEFKEEVQNCFARSYLRKIWLDAQNCKTHLNNLKQKKKIDKKYVGAINTFLDLAFDALSQQSGEYPFDSAFMYYFLILEASAKQVIDEDHPIESNGRFAFEFRSNHKKLKFFDKDSQNKTDKNYLSKGRRIVYYQKLCNLIDFANVDSIDPGNLVNLRNDFNHPDLVNNRRIAIINKEHVIEIFRIVNSLLSNLI